jgi:hypothetical protein
MNNNQSESQLLQSPPEAIAIERAKVTATIIDKIRRAHDIDTIFT